MACSAACEVVGVRWHNIVVVVACSTSCATRSVPAELPDSSAVSSEAAEAPHATLGVALREDPPLPGKEGERWPGLAPRKPVEAEHERGQQGQAPAASEPPAAQGHDHGHGKPHAH
jgi:hypothetical protein